MASRLTPEVVRHRLESVPFEKRFYCADGTYLSNLAELAAALESMSEDMYQRYAAAPGNDFSIWVNHVIGDDKLARDLDKAGSRMSAAKAVASRIAFLNGKMPAD